ncbi:MAG: cation:proton antiporter, partial [Thermosynechococcaceae cyanobacterium]
ILAGVVVGPHGINLLERDETIELLGTVGLLFLMFLGGLETSVDDLKQNAKAAIGFGLLTFIVPMVFGTAAMMALGYDSLAAVLVASCLASHTLVALPILNKYGVMKTPPITATLGGTLITNVLALLVLAVVVKAKAGGLTLSFWLFIIPALLIFTFATLWGIPRLGRWFFRKFGHDEGAEFAFVLVALFVVSDIAGRIEIEPIVGAFLVGVAITQQIPALSPLMNRIQFIGNALFIPFFLISVGMLVDPLILFKEPKSLLVAGVIILAEVASKYVAAWGSGRAFGWTFPSTMTVFGMSVAQAASTLAAVTVAFNLKIVDEATVNGIIAMILVSCILSPWVADRWGSQIQPTIAEDADTDDYAWGKRILVPIANPNTEDNLLNLAILLTKKLEGKLLPLHILSDRQDRISAGQQMLQQQLLAAAEDLAHSAVVDVEPIGRVDNSISRGMVRTAAERQASLILCGWKGYSSYRDSLFGSVIDDVIHRAAVPVLVARFPQPIENVQRVVLAMPAALQLPKRSQLSLELAQHLAEELKAELVILSVFTGPTKRQKKGWLTELPEALNVQELRGEFVRCVSKQLLDNDLLILPARRQLQQGQLVIKREPERIAHQSWDTSMIVVHTPIKTVQVQRSKRPASDTSAGMVS